MSTTVSSHAPRRTGLLILLLAYAGFVALGLSNSLMGVAWPSIRSTFGLPLDALGVLLIGNTTGYMIASAVSGRLMALMNVGTLLAGGCGLAAAALLATGSAPAWPVLVVLGLAAGLSGGAIDGSLNAYAAAHFSPRAMNWLHASFGIGATLGPAIMTAVIAGGLGWRAGYWIVGAAQPALAGTWVSLYWGSLTLGRILFGFAVQRIAPTTLLRLCMAGAVLSALAIWLNIAPWLTFGGIALMGLALAPQFPLLMSATPGYLGARHAANGVGFQVAAASLG